MATFMDDWKGVLEDFQDSVSKDLHEMRQCKAEVQAIKAELQKQISHGLYYRDRNRLVVSAPEIIIGNVDESGTLMSGVSKVTIRAGEVELQGVGSNGSVKTSAASIRQTAVDTGIDGQEAVVWAQSEVVSQATSIVLESNDAIDVFSQRPSSAGRGGGLIHADGSLRLEASIAAEQHKAMIESKIKELEQSKKELEKISSDQKKSFDNLAKQLEQIADDHEKITADETELRVSTQDLGELQDQFDFYSGALAKATESWIGTISTLAEVSRQITALKAEKGNITTGDAYKKESTGANVSIVGEHISMASADGEGNLRDNEGAGVSIVANEVSIESREDDMSLKKEGSVSISAKTLNLTTVNPAELEYDKETGEIKKGKYPVEGDVFIRSKNITLEAVDNEIEDGKEKETALTKEGKIAVRAESMDFTTTDTEGKATGSIGINSKAVSIRSIDVDKEKRTDDKLAAGGTMLLLSEKIYVGAKDKDHKSKKLQAVSEEVGLFADKTLEAQQGDGKAVVQLDGGNASIAGSKTQLYGDTTVNAKTEIKGDLKAPKATIDNVEAKSSFKSSNISDGIAVPAPAASASLSAKLKTEDLAVSS
ncbi:MAG: hypothetical protein J5711_03290 [Bacteroidales bacterium]|nr:hypothetical protein [Bacteroidales bacterium]